ncbi:uncharacterized protein L969DRAFT_93822 [Mixia osmundae IAM 14324]|uniref:VWFA domain-containing protein n=1 Tax=Mixia osmundae (strain CBS 9802 / IAM 14324 / JCM 22182 / KY 12970) TaxID=764103 RepID=G7E9P3_MIXOS|nr:uncharacterized protein L969DRAFT_93822 [Mixia osmundae IAM 14324]KEI39993.1 hypothetical protein L969DRAFT_93822 [Mixia osmundae IAM 14324]GAA99362.1 hypothetical protein E5Q_06058 [Mixia osmundae IAM 14324]
MASLRARVSEMLPALPVLIDLGSSAEYYAQAKAALERAAMDGDDNTMGESSGSPHDLSGPTLDLCFVLDVTGSMGSYIKAACQNIESICDEIARSGRLATPEHLRIAIIAYRDHPPQDNSFVTKIFPFSAEVAAAKDFLSNQYASGGGDGPEASTAALKAAYELDWRENASKVTVLITDAPPHGLGEYGDAFAAGSPDGVDPLQLARSMALRGIPIFVVACEPALSGYSYATDFYRGLVKLASGVLVPLTTANLLAHVIVGSALEQLDLDRLINEVGTVVAERVHSGQESVDDVARELHEKLMLRNETTKQMLVEDIYRDSDEARHNIEIWANATDLASARPHLQRIKGSRFTDKYLASRYQSASSYSYPALPARTKTPPPAPKPTPASPPRGIVSDFAAFSAPTTMSMAAARGEPAQTGFGTTRPLSTFDGSASAFGLVDRSARTPVSPQANAASSEDDIQGVELKLQSISFDQARRITMQSAFRAMR